MGAGAGMQHPQLVSRAQTGSSWPSSCCRHTKHLCYLFSPLAGSACFTQSPARTASDAASWPHRPQPSLQVPAASRGSQCKRSQRRSAQQGYCWGSTAGAQWGDGSALTRMPPQQGRHTSRCEPPARVLLERLTLLVESKGGLRQEGLPGQGGSNRLSGSSQQLSRGCAGREGGRGQAPVHHKGPLVTEHSVKLLFHLSPKMPLENQLM